MEMAIAVCDAGASSREGGEEHCSFEAVSGVLDGCFSFLFSLPLETGVFVSLIALFWELR